MLGRGKNRIDGELYTIVDGPIDGRMAKRLQSLATNVHVLNSKPSIESLDALSPWSGKIQRLIVTDPGVYNLSGLEKCTGLIELTLFPAYSAKPADVAHEVAASLQLLAMRGGLVDVLRLPRIGDLTLENPTPENLRALSTLSQLRRLKVAKPGEMPALLPSSLKQFELTAYRWKDSDPKLVAGLDGVESLVLAGIRGLTTLQPFAQCRNLHELVIEDCPQLISIEGPKMVERRKPLLIGRVPLR